LLISDLEVAPFVLSSGRSVKQHTTLKVLRLTCVTIDGTAADITKTVHITDECQGMVVWISVTEASIHGVSGASVNGDWPWSREGWAAHTLRVCVATWIFV
jgi:hypothetical protein